MLGIDLGGTKIEGVVLTPSGDVAARERVPTPRSYPLLLETLVDLVMRLEQATEPVSQVGLGTPGAVSPDTGLMKNCYAVPLNGRPFPDDLARALGKTVHWGNDADCFALSEARDGAGREGTVVFGVILGTGVGGGIVVHRQRLSGPNRIAGEWGHNPVPLPVWAAVSERGLESRTCGCGRRNCIEAWLAGPGLEKTARALTGDAWSGSALARSADAGEAWALEVVEWHGRLLGLALAGVVNILDPDVIVLGGGLSNLTALYPAAREAMAEAAYTDALQTPLVAARHGDASGVRGAAWLCEGRQP